MSLETVLLELIRVGEVVREWAPTDGIHVLIKDIIVLRKMRQKNSPQAQAQDCPG